MAIKWHNYTEWQSCVGASTAGVVEALEDRYTGSAACCVCGGGGSGWWEQWRPPSCTGNQNWRGLTRLVSMNLSQSEGEVGSRPMAWNL